MALTKKKKKNATQHARQQDVNSTCMCHVSQPFITHTRLCSEVILLSWKTHRCSTLFSLSFFLVNPPTSSHVSPCPAPFSSPRLFPRPGWQEVSTMCALAREITRTGRGGRNAPDGQEVDSTVWFSWLAGGEREGDCGGDTVRQTSRGGGEGEKDWEWGGGTGCSEYMDRTGKRWEGFQLLYPPFIKWHSTQARVWKKKVKTKQNRINRRVNKPYYLNEHEIKLKETKGLS